MVYLGLFSRILDWILGKIFSPIFTFISNLLTPVFEWLFNNILGPIITFAFETVFPVLWNLFLDLFAGILYEILVLVLRLIDVMQKAFDVLIGISSVTYIPPSGAKVTGLSLLEVLFMQTSVRQIFLQISFIGLGLALLFTIYAVARSMLDFDYENKRPVGAVLKAFFKTSLSFLMVPLFALFMIKLSGIVLVQTQKALGTGDSSLGCTVFLISSLEAAQDEKFNQNQSLDDTLRRPYSTGTKDYKISGVVKKDFKFRNIDYLVGFSAGIFMVIILAMCLMVFVRRIFEIILLYISSPLFVSVMPLDDGEKFGKWRSMFIGRIFTGFGSAIGMRVYLMMLPLIMNGKIDFTAGGELSGSMNYLIKLLFALGGAYAIYKSNTLLTSIVSSEAAGAESQSAALGAGAVFGSVSSAAGLARSTGGAISNYRAEKRAEDARYTKSDGSKMNKQERKSFDDFRRFKSFRDKREFEGLSGGSSGALGGTGGGSYKDSEDYKAFAESNRPKSKLGRAYQDAKQKAGGAVDAVTGRVTDTLSKPFKAAGQFVSRPFILVKNKISAAADRITAPVSNLAVRGLTAVGETADKITNKAAVKPKPADRAASVNPKPEIRQAAKSLPPKPPARA